jgi:hypothetical protein
MSWQEVLALIAMVVMGIAAAYELGREKGND